LGSRTKTGDIKWDSNQSSSGEHLSKQLKADIRKKYNIKTEIIGPAVCAMAMSIDYNETVQEIQRNKDKPAPPAKKSQNKGEEGEAKPTQFTQAFLYGGQGKKCDTLAHASYKVIPTNQAGSQEPSMELPTNTTTSPAAVDTPTGRVGTTEASAARTGLEQPRLGATGEAITGANKHKMRAENWKRRRALQQAQSGTHWTTYKGDMVVPPGACKKTRPKHRNAMCPTGLAMSHPATDTLVEWATFGCPTKTGQPWKRADLNEAIAWGPHQSALTPEAIEHFAEEIRAKVRINQARVIEWDSIKDNPPAELKILPIASIPHKSKAFWSILDLSFRLRLKNGGFREAVNNTTTKTAPGGAIYQIRDCLSRIIHAFAEADADAKIFMAKWDIKDGFWRMDCREDEEWNFSYVIPQPEGQPVCLVVPTSLQMG
jgi:hypothetical protein